MIMYTITRVRSRIRSGCITSGPCYNPNHRWVYLPEQKDNEIWLFKQADIILTDAFREGSEFTWPSRANA